MTDTQHAAPWTRLGLIAGGGGLPREILNALDPQSVLVIRLKGFADDPFDDPERIEATVMGVGNALTEELEARVMSQAPVRVALTGGGAGIPLWQAMTLLGRDECLARMRAARERLG